MKKNNKQLHKGFSLVELIVILSLFAIMASIVTFDFSQYQKNIERVNLATDIALSFRQMQVYGISSSNRVVGGSSFEEDSDLVSTLVNQDLIQDTSYYGVELDIDSQTITLFQEMGGSSNEYDDETDLLIDKLAILGDNQVQRICAATEGTLAQVDSEGSCSFDGNGEEITGGTFTVMFQRPFPDAGFYFSEEPSLSASSLVIVVGVQIPVPGEINYVYLDAVGLIQSVNADAVLAS